MFITEEIYMTRHEILEESLIEAGVREDLRDRWLAYDLGLLRALVKKDISECTKRYHDEPVATATKPLSYLRCPYKKTA